MFRCQNSVFLVKNKYLEICNGLKVHLKFILALSYPQSNQGQRNSFSLKASTLNFRNVNKKNRPSYREFSFQWAIFSKVIFHFGAEGRQYRILVAICSSSHIWPQRWEDIFGYKMREQGNQKGTLLTKVCVWRGDGQTDKQRMNEWMNDSKPE